MNGKVLLLKYHQDTLGLGFFAATVRIGTFVLLKTWLSVDQMEMFIVSFGMGLRLIIFVLTWARPACV